MKGLTKRQLEMATYIQDFIQSNRYSPSYREIMKHFGFTSIGSVAKHINTLKRKGVLTNEQHCSRSISLIGETPAPKDNSEFELPYIGFVSVNAPIEIFAHPQTLSLPRFLVTDAEMTYILRARGNSLKDEMILDGDLLVVETRTEPNEEEIILGNTRYSGTLIRKYHTEGNYVRLMSQSPQTPPIITRHEDLEIKGVLISVLRLC